MTGMITSIPVAATVAILPSAIATVTGVDTATIIEILKDSPLLGILLWFILSHSKQMNEHGKQTALMMGTIDRLTKGNMLSIVTNEASPKLHREEAMKIITEIDEATSSKK